MHKEHKQQIQQIRKYNQQQTKIYLQLLYLDRPAMLQLENIACVFKSNVHVLRMSSMA